MLSIREKFIILVNNDILKKSDAIVLLEGDGLNRAKKAIDLYKEKWAEKIVFSGGIKNLEYGSYPFEYFEKVFLDSNIPPNSIILENASLNTKAQAINVLDYALQSNWKRLILVASHYHQFRAYLTFLKVILKNKLEIELINAPSSNLNWFENLAWGARYELLDTEFNKIKDYKQNGDLASFEEAIEYQKWKEKLL